MNSIYCSVLKIYLLLYPQNVTMGSFSRDGGSLWHQIVRGYNYKGVDVVLKNINWGLLLYGSGYSFSIHNST